jgi:hypothetical protein
MEIKKYMEEIKAVELISIKKKVKKYNIIKEYLYIDIERMYKEFKKKMLL